MCVVSAVGPGSRAGWRFRSFWRCMHVSGKGELKDAGVACNAWGIWNCKKPMAQCHIIISAPRRVLYAAKCSVPSIAKVPLSFCTARWQYVTLLWHAEWPRGCQLRMCNSCWFIEKQKNKFLSNGALAKEACPFDLGDFPPFKVTLPHQVREQKWH